MSNDGMKAGVNSEADAKKYLKYLDNPTAPGVTAYTYLSLSLFSLFTLDTLQNTEPYKPIDGLKLQFDISDGPNPFRIIENDDGELLLADSDDKKHHYALCQYMKITPNKEVYEYRSDGRKAYKMSSYKMTFDEAKQFCKDDVGNAVLAMPMTPDDIKDINDIVDCK